MHFKSLLCIFAGVLIAASTGAVAAQTPSPPAPSPKTTPVPQPSRPNWNELTSAQREALAPLAGMWETLEADRKKKWLEMAGRFPRLTPDAQKRMHERMGEYARLTPEQRKTARENFRQAYELPADQRQEKLQRYQALPDEKKRALTEQAAKKAGDTTSIATVSCARTRPLPQNRRADRLVRVTDEQDATFFICTAAGLLVRLAAMIYEAVLVFAVVFAVSYVLLATHAMVVSIVAGPAHRLQGALFVAAGAYFVICWARTGQTLALKAWRLKVIDSDGRPPRSGRAIARYVLAWHLWLPGLAIAAVLQLSAVWTSLCLRSALGSC